MPRPGRPTDNLDDAIKLYETSDRGVDPIARELNVPRRALRQALVERGTLRSQREANNLARARGEATRDNVGDTLPVEEITSDYLSGMSENALAKKYAVARGTIGRLLNNAGVERRGPGDANRVMAAARTPEEHARNAEAAHAAVRGRKYAPGERAQRRPATFDELCRRAAHRHGKAPSNATELLYAAWLRERGFEPVHQHAIGPYNVDLTVEPVAVEIFGGGWHAWGHHAATGPERARYICDAGWLLVVLWVNQNGQRLTAASADYITSCVELARRDPSVIGQYRMAWGDGKEVPVGGRDFDQIARVPARGRSTDLG